MTPVANTPERVILIVLDSVGVGALPDAPNYGDEGANTLAHTAEHVGGLALPTLQALGLGNLLSLRGVPPAAHPTGAWGKCAEASAGKDTSTGHWELAGLRIDQPFPLFPSGFPGAIVDAFRARTGRDILGNRPASGTEIIQELGEEHMRTGALIVYTSGDSVFQVAAHEDVVPVAELYCACAQAREILNPWGVGRVIARPFTGPRAGSFVRTYRRRDFSLPPPAPTVLDSLAAAGLAVVGIGKIRDIYAGRGITRDVPTKGNADGMDQTIRMLQEVSAGLIFTNLVDFDTLYGHRRDPTGYARCLQEFDAELARLVAAIRPASDLLLLTADHGNDPTMPGSDHTREYVPLVAFGPGAAAGVDLGTRQTLADVGATIADIFRVPPPAHGTSFAAELGAESR